MHTSLAVNLKIDRVKVAQASGTGDVNGDATDMANYEGVMYLTTIATANAGNFLKVQQGNAANLSDAADLAASKITPAADGMTVVADVFRPFERYVRPVVVRGAATAVGEIYAIRYSGHRKPTVNELANVLAQKTLISPSEGTA